MLPLKCLDSHGQCEIEENMAYVLDGLVTVETLDTVSVLESCSVVG